MHRLCSVALFASICVIVACGKKADNAKSGSGSGASATAGSADKAGSADRVGSAGSATAAAAGSGSATAVVGSGSGSGSAAASGAGDLKITGKRGGNDFGTFDGAKAVYIKDKDKRFISLAANCPKYDCKLAGSDGTGADNIAKVCAGASEMVITLNDSSQPGEPKVGAAKVEVYVGGESSGGTLTSDFTPGVTLSEVTADHVNGAIDLKDGDSEAHGTFTAKACK